MPAVWDEVSNLFKLCKKIENEGDVDNLYAHIMNGFAYEAMTDYPDAANFLNPMPAWPVNASCEFFVKVGPKPPASETTVGDETVLTDR